MPEFSVGNLFGFRIGRPEVEAKQEKNFQTFVPPEDDGSLNVSGGIGMHQGIFMNMDSQAKNEAQLITKYRRTSLEPEAKKAIDDIVNEAIVMEDKDPVVQIVLDDLDQPENIKKMITEEFKHILKLLDFQNMAYDIFWKWYVDGRLYYHKIIDVKKPREGLKELRYIDPRKIKKIRQELKVNRDSSAMMHKKVIEYFLYNPKGIGNHQEGLRVAIDSVTYCHSGLLDEKTTTILSHVHPSMKNINQLRWLEDATVIYRLSRAPERRIFYVDIGNLPKGKAEQYMKDIMTKFKNKLVYDANTGEIKQNKKFTTMLEDFWLPRREGSRGTEISTLPGGQNLGEIEDVEYFLRKLYKSLNVPITRLDSEGSFNMGRSTEITRDEVKFSKFIKRLRRRFTHLFDDLLETHLELKGIITKGEWKILKEDVYYDFQKDNHFEELKKAEVFRNRLEQLNEADAFVGRYWSLDWVKKEILHQTDEDIAKMAKQMKADEAEGDEEGEGDTNFGAFTGRPDVPVEPPIEDLPPEAGGGPPKPPAAKPATPAKPKKPIKTSVTDKKEQYVRQVKPRNESYTSLVEKVQTFLAEGKGASTYFEGVIAACHNLSNQKEPAFKGNILKDNTVKQFLSAADSGGKPFFATNGKTDEEKLDILYKFAQVCKKSLPGSSSDAGAGQSQMKVSKPWTDITNKSKDTSKADIGVSGNKTSVKGPSAQLMSGKKLETKATILAALEIAGEGDKLRNDLVAAVDGFVDNTRTIGAEVGAGLLKKMSAEDAKKTGNDAAKKIVDDQEKMKVEITKLFETAFKSSNVGNAFAKEAMTGWEKFGGKAFAGQSAGNSNGEATHMLIWDYRMDRMKFLKIDDSFISATAKKMRVRPDMKSGSYNIKGQKAGYSFYQALRVSVDVVLDKTSEIVVKSNEEIEHNKTLLSEGSLTEFSFKKKVQDILNWLKNKIMGLWKWLAERIKKIVDSVMEKIKKGTYYALQAFELDVDVNVNTTVRF